MQGEVFPYIQWSIRRLNGYFPSIYEGSFKGPQVLKTELQINLGSKNRTALSFLFLLVVVSKIE